MSPDEELEHYASLDGTEWGETMLALCHLYRYSTYISTELVELIKKEVNDNLKYVKENATIVEESETYTRKIKTLEWYE